MPYLTPETLPSGTICRTVFIPDDIEWITIVNGALSRLIHASNFEQFGSITPEETAERFQQMFFEFRDSECAPVTPIGTIVMWPSDTLPDGWLLCDGTAYLREDYPELEVLFPSGGSWGGSASEFVVPDFSGRSPMQPTLGVLDAPGKILGAATHALTTGETPEHNHGVTDPGHIHTQNVGGLPAYLPVGGSGRTAYGVLGTSSLTRVVTDSQTTGISTQNTGGGDGHNNVHPVLGINFIIFAGI